ncbi:hypothetical protein [Arthrobacter methylotrophus]|uniref:hypothetical protein n=1 Tax=Arthrobacter methylotrophus TaxID=121291 RepID=UPI0031F1C159
MASLTGGAIRSSYSKTRRNWHPPPEIPRGSERSRGLDLVRTSAATVSFLTYSSSLTAGRNHVEESHHA